LPKDPLVQPLELGRGIDAELLREDLAEALVRGEGVRLPARSIQGDDQMAPEPLTKAVFVDERLGLAEDVGVTSALDIGADALLEGLEMQVVQPSDHTGKGLLGGEVGECGSPPQLQGLPQQAGRAIGLTVSPARFPHQVLEEHRV
jgi:hypothetical protein